MLHLLGVVGAQLVTATIEEYGHVDVLVNNAGGGINKSPEKWTVAEWHQVIT